MSSLPIEGTIYYVGSDSDFTLEMNKFFGEKSKAISCHEILYTPGSLVKFCSRQKIDVIFIDFSEAGLEVQLLLEETLFLKRIGQFKSILLVAVFKNEFQKQEYPVIFSSGFQLSFIKGSESDALFRDSYFIGLRKKMEFPVLALARNINLPLEIGVASTISSMDKTEFRIETDFEGLRDKLKVELKMFPDLKCSGYEIKETHPPSYQYPMMTAYTIAYPFSGPWIDDSEENIQPETVETWLDNASSDFSSETKIFVRIYSNDLSIVNGLYKNEQAAVQVNFQSDTRNMHTEILISKPSLIFFNLDSDTEEDQEEQITLKLLDFLLSISMGVDYRPIIIVTNCNSTSPALQKAYNYPMIVATQNKLETELCLTLIKKFKAKPRDSFEVPRQYFNPGSTYRSIDVFANFMITNLTEHEVTFISEYELPMFTVLHFKLPLDFHATLVPPIMALDKKNDKHHYMAFIHGLTEEQLMVLRKFVNQIIYSPMKDFSEESVKKSMGEALINETPEEKPVEIVKEVKKPVIAKPIDLKKYIVTGKSKL